VLNKINSILLELNHITILGFCFLIQLCFVSYTFPISELFSSNIAGYIDNPAHLYRIFAAVNLAETNNLIGYDPFFGAGVPVGMDQNPAAKVPTLIAILFPFISPIIAWKLYIFVSAVIAPICLPITAKLFKLDTGTQIFASIFGILIWWVSMFHWFHTAGLVSFVLASFLSLPFLGLLYRFITDTFSLKLGVGLSIFGMLGILVHPLFPLPIVFCGLGILIIERKNIDLLKASFIFAVIPILSLAPHLIWLIPRYFDKIYISAPRAHVDQSLVGLSIMMKEMLGQWDYPAHGTRAYPLIIIAAISAAIFIKDKFIRKITLLFLTVGFFLELYSFTAAYSRQLAIFTQPNRFSPVGYLFLVIPASIGVVELIKSVLNNSKSLLNIKAPIGFLGILSILFLLNINEIRREISYQNFGHIGKTPPEISTDLEYTNYISNWIKENTKNDARILFENSTARIHDGGHLSGYLAYSTNRQLIGGPYPSKHFVSFWNGHAFGKPINDITKETFEQYLDLYNVGWAIAFTEDSKNYLEKLDGVELMSSFKMLNFYALSNEGRSFFIKGNGRVTEATHNRIELEDLVGEKIIIKYHYLKGLESSPPIEINSTKFMDDENGFITLHNPPAKLTLYLN